MAKQGARMAAMRKEFEKYSQPVFVPTEDIPHPRLLILKGESVDCVIREPFPQKIYVETRSGKSEMFRLIVEHQKQLWTLVFAAKPTNTLVRGFMFLYERHKDRENVLEGIKATVSSVPFTHDTAGETVKYEVKEIADNIAPKK